MTDMKNEHTTSQDAPGMPLLYLSGGMKFGWALVGFLLGPVAILLAWLTNLTNYPEAKNEAIKYSIIGFVVMLLIGFLLTTLFGVAACSAVSSMANMADPRYWY